MMRYLLPIIVWILSALPAFSATVDLTVREQYGVARANAPVTTGVPLPETGGITDVTKLRLLDGTTPIDAQFRVLSRWHGKVTDTTKNIQWVLVDTQVTQIAHSNDTYTLEWGSSITTPSVSSPITDSSTASAITVNTGAATFTISKTDFNIIDAVDISGTSFLDSTSKGAVILDSFGANYYAKNVVTSVEVEEDGPMRLVVVAKGFHGNDAGTDNNFYGYTTRIHFYKGKSTVRVVHTLENRPETPRGALAFQDYSLELDLSLASGTKNYMIYGDTETTGTIGDSDKAYIYQDSDGEELWNDANSITVNELYNHTSFKGFKIFKNTTELQQSDQALGVLDISDTNKGMTVGVHQFWQRFPKKIMAEGNGKVTVGLLPDDFDFMFFVEDMSMINTEIFLNFHTGAYSSTVRDEIIDRLHPLLLVSPPSWYAANYDGTLSQSSIAYYENGITPQRLEAPTSWGTVDTITYPLINAPFTDLNLTNRDQGFYSAYQYGPRSQADQNGYNFEGPVEHFINFMQTGQPGSSGDVYRYFNSDDLNHEVNTDYDLFWGGVDFAQHWMYSRATNLPKDFDHLAAGLTTRVAVKDYYWQANYPLRGGRIGTDPVHTLASLTPRANGSLGGSQPSFGWYAMDESHITSNHIVEYYRLTGDMAALDYGHSIGEFVKNYLPNDDMLDGTYDNPPAVFPGDFAERTIAWPILTLMNMYNLLGDDDYLNWAKEAAKILDSAQDKDRGFHRPPSAGISLAQYSKSILALGALYDATGDDKYFDISEGLANWSAYYITDPDTHYLTGYGYYNNTGATLTYPQATVYYDSTHHLNGPAVVWNSSSTRLNYMYGYMYKMTGKSIYKTIIDTAYDLGNGANTSQVFLAASPWAQLYLSTRYNSMPIATTSEITPSVVNNGGGSYTLSWTVPEGVNRYRIKYSDKPIVSQIIYPDDSGVKENWWAVTDEVAGPPVPETGGSMQTVTLTGLASTGLNFAVRGYSEIPPESSVCDINHLSLCTQGECAAAGGNWCTDVCQVAECSSPTSGPFRQAAMRFSGMTGPAIMVPEN